MSKQVKGVKGPLIFSAVLAAIAGIATMVFATGGGTRELRVDLGLTAAAVAVREFSRDILVTAVGHQVLALRGDSSRRSPQPCSWDRGPDPCS